MTRPADMAHSDPIGAVYHSEAITAFAGLLRRLRQSPDAFKTAPDGYAFFRIEHEDEYRVYTVAFNPARSHMPAVLTFGYRDSTPCFIPPVVAPFDVLVNVLETLL